MALNGIDIASHQERIDLTAVPCDFVIIKATQGTKYVNPDFRRAYEQAINAGKLVGVYHYASSGGAIAEADHFLDTIGTAVGRAILCLDWEKGDNANFSNVAYAHKWLEYVRSRTGVTPFIYMSKSVCRDFNWSNVASLYPLWVAQYGNSLPTGYKVFPWTDRGGYGAWKSCTIFQYSSTGRLTGWSGNLDLNKAYLTREEWKRIASTTKKTEAAATAGTYTAETYKVGSYDLCDVKYGDRGEVVRFLQQLLNAEGFPCSADGIFGAKTEKALADYDCSIHNIKCGKGTWERLLR